ncbi:Uncharacterised protein [Mycobacteroides abscessus subsp. bolletii]|nr:Uncharacterised protein [Mycobacteroides abscessus subsp. bolletii]SKX37752.1 Uncharacterised protein [Mycobacteroides abscessus subsp. bolletii]
MTPPPGKAGPENESTPNPGRSTLNIGGEMLSYVRGAVNLVRKKTGRDYSLRQFTDEAFSAQLRVIADTYNEGRPIQPVYAPLEKGRPRQVMHGASPVPPDGEPTPNSPA